MSIISNRYEERGRACGALRCEVSRARNALTRVWLPTVYFLLFTILIACDFQGPWSYYPEEREIYQGVFIYGYIVDGEGPNVCFKKLYQLDEAAVEGFAFYDSAEVFVKWVREDSTLDQVQLSPIEGNPNCFVGDPLRISGVEGEHYELHASIKWDSAGHNVSSTYTSSTYIPENFGLKGVNIPIGKDKYRWHENDGSVVDADFLEFPLDMEIYKFAMDYDSAVGGVLLSINYDNYNGGESMNTTMANMISSFASDGPGEDGFVGFTMKSPYENTRSMGFEGNLTIGGFRNLDTLMAPNFTFPVGRSTIHFYATTRAYMDYRDYVIESFDDPRIVAKSNIEGGMGVWTGMKHISLDLEMKAESFIKYSKLAYLDCDWSDFGQETWATKTCRLYEDIYCMGVINDTLYSFDDLIEGNRVAWDNDLNDGALIPDNCRAVMYAAAMWQGKTYNLESDEFKDPEYGAARKEDFEKGLKKFCFATDFENDACKDLRQKCVVDKEKNECKEDFWEWCSDRAWNIDQFPQCASALISQYYLEEQKSSVIKREIDRWCKENSNEPQCKR